MTKKTKIKKFIISAISCILLVCALCMTASDALARNAGCSWSQRCYPGCRYEKVETCTLCPLFVLVFNTVSKVGSLSAKNFSNSIIQVVVVFFAVWLAMEVIKFVSSMKTKDLKDFVQSLITKGFTVILVITILKTGVGNFYNIFIQPVYNTALHMAQIAVEDTNSEETNKKDKKEDKSIAGIKEIKNGLPSSIGASIVRTMTMMENRIRKIKSLGGALVCSSIQDAWIPIFPKIKYLIYGGATWILTVAMIVVIPFLMIDAVFELGVATLLMPFAVGAYAFNYTRKHCKKVWDTFLNSACNFLFTSVVVLILLGALQSATQENMGSIDGFDKMFVIGGVGDNVYSAFKDAVDWRSPMFLNLVFIFLLAWAVMEMGKEFAGEIASSLSPTGIGSQLGGQIGSMAKGAALKASAPLRSAAGEGAKAAGRLAGRGISNLRTNVMKSRFEKNKDKAVQNEDGTQSVTVKGKTYTMDKDGNITRGKAGKTKDLGNGRRERVTNQEIRTDGVIVKRKLIQVEEFKDGKWVQVDSRIEDSRMRITRNIDIVNDDGTVNVEGMNKLLAKTSGTAKEAVVENMNRVINQDRFSKASFDPENDAQPVSNFDPENDAQPESKKDYLDEKTGEMVTEYRSKKTGKLMVSRTKLNRSTGIAERRLTSIDKKTGEVEILDKNYLDEKTGEMVTKYRSKKTGELVVLRTKINRETGIAESRLTRIDEKTGKVEILESDGIRNKMTNMILEKGTDINGININEIGKYCEKDKSGKVLAKVAFGYTERAKELIASGVRESELGVQRDKNGKFIKDNGMFNNDIVRDERGNIIGGQFYRYMQGVKGDTSFAGKHDGVGNYGQTRRGRTQAAKLEFKENRKHEKSNFLNGGKSRDGEYEYKGTTVQDGEGLGEYLGRRRRERRHFKEGKRELRQERREIIQEAAGDNISEDDIRSNKRRLNDDAFLYGGGNDYSIREADMNFKFANSKSPRSLKRSARGFFGWK